MLPPIFLFMKPVNTLFPFSALSPEAAQDLQESGQFQQWSADQVVFNQGEPCQGLHVVTAGMIQVHRTSLDGREQIVHVQAPGSFLAVAPLLDNAPYPVHARAVVASETFFITTEQFDRLFHDHTDFARAILTDMADRHRKTLDLLDTIALKPVLARVATILMQAARHYDAAFDNGQFEFTLTQEQLASRIATTREGVARSFARLRKEGLIDQRGSGIKILDWNRLALVADAVSDAAAFHVPPLGVASEELH